MSPLDYMPAVQVEADSLDDSALSLLVAVHNPGYYARPAKRWVTHPDAYKMPRQPTAVECDKRYHKMHGLAWRAAVKFEISAGSSPHPRSSYRHLPTLPAKIRNLRGQLSAWNETEAARAIEERNGAEMAADITAAETAAEVTT